MHIRFTWRAILAALALVSPAAATVIVPMDDAALVASSQVVVLGTVVRVESHLTADGRIVTDATIALEQVVKGRPGGSEIVVTVPGGVVAGRIAQVFGAPRFAPGEHVVTFLKRNSRDGFRPNGLALGAYRVEATPRGELLARRRIPSADVRRLPAFLERLAELDAGVPEAEATPDTALTPAPDTGEYTFLGGPSRWFEEPVTFGLANVAADLGGDGTVSVLAAAMRAWNDVPTADVLLRLGAVAGPAPSVAGGVCDGTSTIQFDDPFGEVQDMVGCSGVLAVGGYCGDGAQDVVGDLVVFRITEGDVTVNPRLASCFGAASVAEVMTHELGHAIGLGHSTDADATMYAWAHFDGRGAAVRADDVAGVSALYPAQTVTTTSSTSSTSQSTSSSTSTSTTSSSSTATVEPPTSSSLVPFPETSTSMVPLPDESTSTTVETSTTSTTVPLPDDLDGDGIPDDADACPRSDDGEVVGDDGCSVCPCEADLDRVPWESHAAYVRCVRDQSHVQRIAGDLSRPERRDAITHGMLSTCGRPETTRCCVPASLGPRCQIRLPEECPADSVAIGAGSCSPNPCGDDGAE